MPNTKAKPDETLSTVQPFEFSKNMDMRLWTQALPKSLIKN